jgi:hypothetical protein
MFRRSRMRRLSGGASPATPRQADRTRQAAAVLALQRSAGNRAVVEILARQPDTKAKPKIVTILGEQVEVSSEAEEKDAARILRLLKDTYGVSLDSAAVRKALRKDKTERGVEKGDVEKIDVVPWAYLDLQDVEAGFKHYAPLLGQERAKSSRKGTPQEVTKMGRLSHYDDDPEGQYLKDDSTIAIFKSHSRAMPDPDESMAVHEIAHAMFGHLVEDFRRKIGYWTTPTDKRNKGTVEAPPTSYGNKNPDEDLAESVMLYFTARDFLRTGQRGKKRGEVGNACKERLAWIEKEVTSWTASDKPARKRKRR